MWLIPHCPALHGELISRQSSSVAADLGEGDDDPLLFGGEKTKGYVGQIPCTNLTQHFLQQNKPTTKASLCFLHALATVTFDKCHLVTLITTECSRMVEIIQSIHHSRPSLHPDSRRFFSSSSPCFWPRSCTEGKFEKRFLVEWVVAAQQGKTVNTLMKPKSQQQAAHRHQGSNVKQLNVVF